MRLSLSTRFAPYRLGFAAMILCAACGGSTVEPLDPKDLTLPPDTRQWIADAQDGVIAARAARDGARLRLATLQAWADVALAMEFSGSKGGSLEERMADLADARIASAESDVAVAEANIELASRKLDLAYAERSMLHDIATYDLAELRGAVGDAKKAAREQTNLRRERKKKARAAETAWWKSYASFAGGSKTASYWTAGIEPLGQDTTASAEGDGKPGEKGEASKAKGATRGRVVEKKKPGKKRKRRTKKRK